MRHRGPDSFLAHFGDYRPSVEPRIGVGDTISVTIWEAGSGGLFSAPLVSDRFSTGANSATIPDQVVGRDGTITVPYAGRVPVAGYTTRAVQTVIEHALEGKAIQPQVLVNVRNSISNTVTVTGEVANGARVPLSIKGDRVMDVIAAAGGIRAPVNETYVQLSRGPVTARVAMTKVTSESKENIYLRPNDVLTLIRDPQTFIAYGATGQNAEIPFDAEGINLSQALAKAGGLWMYVLLNCQVSRNLQLSFLSAGPTEFRIVLIGLNCWMYFAGHVTIPVGPVMVSPYEFAFIGMGIVSIGLFAINVFRVARRLRLEDSLQSWGERL